MKKTLLFSRPGPIQLPLLTLLIWCLLPGTDAQRKHEGVSITVAGTQTLSLNLARHTQAFEDTFGGKVTVVSPDGYLGAVADDVRNGSQLYQGFLTAPRNLIDFVELGLEVLTERVREDENLGWFDVLPFFRSFNSVYNSQVYTMTLAGAYQVLYYRMDILEMLNRTVPKTWEEYLETAAMAHGLDLNGDGVPDYGTCVPRSRNNQMFLLQVVSSYMQSKGTSEGIFFDVDTMEPLIDTEGFRAGLDMYMRLRDYGPPVGPRMLATFRLFGEGRCLFAPTFPNVGPITRDTRGLNGSTWDTIGADLLPGSPRVYDYKKKRWIDCREEPTECPHATDNINHAPFAATGGQCATIPANQDPVLLEATYDFFALVGRQSDKDVMNTTGFLPYRKAHLELDLWLNSGFDERSAISQIAGIKKTQEHENIVVDMRLQGAQEYLILLNDLLILLNGDEITQEEFIVNVTEVWQEKINATVGGWVVALQQYRDTIGLEPKIFNFDEEIEVTKEGRIALAVVAGVVALLCFLLAVMVAINNGVYVWQYPSTLFLNSILTGALIACTGIMVMSADASTGTCTAALWLYVVGMAIIVGTLFATILQAWRINDSKTQIEGTATLPIVALFVLLFVVVLAVWSGMDAPSDYISTRGMDDFEFVVICDSPDDGLAFWSTIITLFGIPLFISIPMISYTDKRPESNMLLLCTYNLTQILILLVIFILALDDPDARYLLTVIAMLIGVSLTLGLVFAPKVFATIVGKGDQQPVDTVDRSTSTDQGTQ